MMATPVLVSVVLSTRNRGEQLVQTLESFCDQQTPADLRWEVIVVDNNSTDSTRAVTERYVAKRPDLFRYVFEGRTGKSIALNRGVNEAQGQILAFTDDDCIADPTWIAAMAEEFAADPSIALLGGRVELYDEGLIPETVSTWPERVVFSSLPEVFVHIIGANMAVRRDVFDGVEGFDPALGPGTRAVSEDLDFVYAVYRGGLKVVYEPRVLVLHNHGRRLQSDVAPVLKKYSIGRGAFYCKHVLKGDRIILKLAYWDVLNSVKKIAAGLRRSGEARTESRQRIIALVDYVRGAAYWATVSHK